MSNERTVSLVDGPPRLSADALRQFVDNFLASHIWDFHNAPDGTDPLTPFLALRLAGFPSEWDPKKIGTVYEYISEAGPTVINGMPTFFSCRFLHTDDWEIVRATIIEEVERRRNIPLAEVGR